MNPVRFNSYKSVKDGPIRKQAFGISPTAFNEMRDRMIDSGFQQEGEVQKSDQYTWCQMKFVGRKKSEA